MINRYSNIQQSLNIVKSCDIGFINFNFAMKNMAHIFLDERYKRGEREKKSFLRLKYRLIDIGKLFNLGLDLPHPLL